jgi:LacI family transcriptional regulator
VANEKGYNLISCISDESYEKEVRTLEILGGGTVDGLILSMAGETQFKNEVGHLLQLWENQIPLVLFDRVTDLIDCDKVVVDDFEAGYNTTRYFLDTGCRTIALVSSIDHSSVGRLRLEGYKKALEQENIPYDDQLVLRVGKSDNLDLLMSLLLNHKKIQGIMALDEMTAVEVQRIVMSKGFRVPEDISIIGFTNGTLSKYVTPALTTVSQHGIHLGETAAEMLIRRIESQHILDPVTKVIKTSLIVRDSTKKI